MKPITKKVLKYAVLPQIIPRLRDLMTTGFGYISFFMAQIYGGVRLLPAHHPYLNPVNMGKFGIRHVITQAAAGLRFKKENIDQIIVFVLILAGLAILLLQFGLLGLALFAGIAHAQTMPTNFAGFFITPSAQNDVAYVLLDRVLGVPGVFLDAASATSCVAANQPCFQFAAAGLADTHNEFAVSDGTWPWPFHEALHGMLQFYSLGLLAVAALIFLYYIIAVAVETAESGTPFGRRFNHVWAPIRMVAALGLLIPVANGLNAGQYITLYAAKYGSGFATNGWHLFLDTIVAGGAQNTPAGDAARLVVTPQAPDPIGLLEYVTILQTCWWAEGQVNESRVCGWMVNPDILPPTGPRETLKPNTTYEQALAYYNNKDVLVVFGDFEKDASGSLFGAGVKPAYLTSTSLGDKYDDSNRRCTAKFMNGESVHTAYRGEIKPTCGEVVLTTTATVDAGGQNSDPGAYYAQKRYFELLKALWFANSGATPNTSQLDDWGIRIAQRYALDNAPDNGNINLDQHKACPMSENILSSWRRLKRKRLNTIRTLAAANNLSRICPTAQPLN